MVLRIKGEVFDFDFVFTGAGAACVRHLASRREERDGTDSAQDCCDSDFSNERIHRFELFMV